MCVFPTGHYKELIVGLTGDPPDCRWCHQILAMALQANQNGGLMDHFTSAPPSKLSKRNTFRTALSSVLANISFVLLDFVASAMIVFP